MEGLLPRGYVGLPGFMTSVPVHSCALNKGAVRVAADGNVALEQVEVLAIVHHLPPQPTGEEHLARLDLGSVLVGPVVVAQAHLHGRDLLQGTVVRAGADVTRVHDDVRALKLVQKVGLQEAVGVRDDVVAHKSQQRSPTARARA